MKFMKYVTTGLLVVCLGTTVTPLVSLGTVYADSAEVVNNNIVTKDGSRIF